MRKLKNWKTEKLKNWIILGNVRWVFPVTFPKIIQFFSFSVFQFPHLTLPKIIQFFSFSVFSFSVVQFILHTCIYMYVLKNIYIFIYLFIWINVYTYMYMVHPLTSVIIPKSIHQSMKKGRLLGGGGTTYIHTRIIILIYIYMYTIIYVYIIIRLYTIIFMCLF